MSAVLLIDHYDSFSSILADRLRLIGKTVQVVKTDELEVLPRPWSAHYSHVVIGPGPGHPHDASLAETRACLREMIGTIPVLGVCLGHQLIAAHFGLDVVPAERIMHGKNSQVEILVRDELFAEVPQNFRVTRYHSFVVRPPSSATCEVEVVAQTSRQEVMALRHRHEPVWGIQYHPEAALTESGIQLLRNFTETAVMPAMDRKRRVACSASYATRLTAG